MISENGCALARSTSRKVECIHHGSLISAHVGRGIRDQRQHRFHNQQESRGAETEIEPVGAGQRPDGQHLRQPVEAADRHRVPQLAPVAEPVNLIQQMHKSRRPACGSHKMMRMLAPEQDEQHQQRDRDRARAEKPHSIVSHPREWRSET